MGILICVDILKGVTEHVVVLIIFISDMKIINFIKNDIGKTKRKV